MLVLRQLARQRGKPLAQLCGLSVRRRMGLAGRRGRRLPGRGLFGVTGLVHGSPLDLVYYRRVNSLPRIGDIGWFARPGRLCRWDWLTLCYRCHR
ncbi:MAG: hypothetical protein ACRDRY_10950 [Pseudonocardiaceae bacterium]